jgi:GAF domain-containing protein
MEALANRLPLGPNFYSELAREVEALADPIWFTTFANAAAALKHNLRDINWVGFYLMRSGELVLGPFQGLPACTRIALGKGVCGTSASKRETLVVADVDQFPGHIACDSASRSEIVIPLIQGGAVIGVLDVDSPLLSRFTDEDRKGLEHVVSKLLAANSFPESF